MGMMYGNGSFKGGIDAAVLAYIGDSTLTTSADNLGDAINEHEEDISEIKSNLTELIQFETQTVDNREWNIIKIPNVGAIAFWRGAIMVSYGSNGANVKPNIPQIQGYTADAHSVAIAQNATPAVYLAYCSMSSTQLDFYARGLTSGSGYLYTSMVIYYKTNS